MSDSEKIKTAFEKKEKALSLNPDAGRVTKTTRARISNGLTCDIEDGAWKMKADMDKSFGGNGEGPSPGTFGRAALSSCLAISYATWAAKLGVICNNIEVEVQSEFDARGAFAIDNIPAGYDKIRYFVKIESAASEEDVLKVIDQAEACSPYHAIFSRPNQLNRDICISAPIE